MNEEETNSIEKTMLEVAKMQSENSFKISELSRKERVKERFAYLSHKYEYLTEEEYDEFTYCKFLIEDYYIKNPIV